LIETNTLPLSKATVHQSEISSVADIEFVEYLLFLWQLR